jgi:hypothetical protein
MTSPRSTTEFGGVHPEPGWNTLLPQLGGRRSQQMAASTQGAMRMLVTQAVPLP